MLHECLIASYRGYSPMCVWARAVSNSPNPMNMSTLMKVIQTNMLIISGPPLHREQSGSQSAQRSGWSCAGLHQQPHKGPRGQRMYYHFFLHGLQHSTLTASDLGTLEWLGCTELCAAGHEARHLCLSHVNLKAPKVLQVSAGVTRAQQGSRGVSNTAFVLSRGHHKPACQIQ